MTPLVDHLRRLIAASGPLTLARYMAEAMHHPRLGYWRRNAETGVPIGADGDYVTAPEISQMFGEIVGLWCLDLWLRAGSPQPVKLVELGPGRGTLLRDVLRAARAVPTFRSALEIHLVETSPALRAAQVEALATIAEAPPACWHDRIETVPAGPALIVANEFFDSLPVHQLAATEAGWRERLVTWDDADHALSFTLSPAPTPVGSLAERLAGKAASGSIFELCPAGLTMAATIGARIKSDGIGALIIDYARDPGDGATVQAVRGHRRHQPLADPGDADLSARVDFAALARAAREAGATVHGPIDQGAFLRALGIELRAQRLARQAAPDQRPAIGAALERLTAPDQMGTLFRVIAVVGSNMPVPAGFPS